MNECPDCKSKMIESELIDYEDDKHIGKYCKICSYSNMKSKIKSPNYTQ